MTGPTPLRRRAAALFPTGLVLVGLMLIGALGGCSSGDGDESFGLRLAEQGEDAGVDYRFVIPAGSGAEIAAGKPLELLPASLDVQVGEVIEIVNDDDRGHLVGPFFIGAGETMRQEFASPGTFEGVCSVHPSGQIVITVR